MKIFCIFISLFVVLLSARPCCADDVCVNESSVQKEASSKQATPEKECQGCSPFFSCSTCAGFIISKTVTHSVAVIADSVTATYPAYQQPYTQQIDLSIWQPPKIS